MEVIVTFHCISSSGRTLESKTMFMEVENGGFLCKRIAQTCSDLVEKVGTVWVTHQIVVLPA